MFFFLNLEWLKQALHHCLLLILTTFHKKNVVFNAKTHLSFRENDDTYFFHIIPRIMLFLSSTIDAKAEKQKSTGSDFDLKELLVGATSASTFLLICAKTT